MICRGTILKDGTIKEENSNKIYSLPIRGTDEEGYPTALFDATEVGGKGYFRAQSIKPYIGMTVVFEKINGASKGYNFMIIKK